MSFDDQNFTFAQQSTRGIYSAIAIGLLFPRRYMVFSALLSVVVGWTLGVAGLLYFGFIDSLTQTGIITNLDSAWAFAVFAVGISVGSAISSYLYFGLLASDDVAADHPELKNIVTHLGFVIGFPLLATVVFVIVLFLNSLSALLGFAIAVLIFTARYLHESFWQTLGRTPTQVTWIARSVLGVAVIAVVSVSVLGFLPDWRLEEWSIALLYGILAYIGIGGPLSSVQHHFKQTLEMFGMALIVRQILEEQRDELIEAAPEDIEIAIDIPEVPRNYQEAKALTGDISTDATDYDEWFEVYRRYIDVYQSLEAQLDESVETVAATGDSAEIETFVAVLARNIHPGQYDDYSVAQEAVSVLDSIVDVVGKGYIADPSELGTAEERAAMVEQSGPEGEILEQIEAAFEPKALS